MRASEEHIDKMLFNYLEGNFSDEKALQVEREIASDPLIMEELNLWKSSYIHNDFYATSVIETSLLQKPTLFNPITFFLNSILVIGITFFSSTNQKINYASTSHLNVFNINYLEPKEPQHLISNQTISVLVKSPATTRSHLVGSLNGQIEEFEILARVSIQVPELSSIPPDWIKSIIIHPKSIKINHTLDAPLLAQKELRKKERAIRRMKKKALQDRMASEFIKGDIPYVVPVNPNNF